MSDYKNLITTQEQEEAMRMGMEIVEITGKVNDQILAFEALLKKYNFGISVEIPFPALELTGYVSLLSYRRVKSTWGLYLSTRRCGNTDIPLMYTHTRLWDTSRVVRAQALLLFPKLHSELCTMARKLCDTLTAVLRGETVEYVRRIVDEDQDG